MISTGLPTLERQNSQDAACFRRKGDPRMKKRITKLHGPSPVPFLFSFCSQKFSLGDPPGGADVLPEYFLPDIALDYTVSHWSIFRSRQVGTRHQRNEQDIDKCDFDFPIRITPELAKGLLFPDVSLGSTNGV
jgi:hypothetical protein